MNKQKTQSQDQLPIQQNLVNFEKQDDLEYSFNIDKQIDALEDDKLTNDFENFNLGKISYQTQKECFKIDLSRLNEKKDGSKYVQIQQFQQNNKAGFDKNFRFLQNNISQTRLNPFQNSQREEYKNKLNEHFPQNNLKMQNSDEINLFNLILQQNNQNLNENIEFKWDDRVEQYFSQNEQVQKNKQFLKIIIQNSKNKDVFFNFKSVNQQKTENQMVPILIQQSLELQNKNNIKSKNMEGVNLLVCPFSQQVDQIFQEVIKYGVRALKFTSDNIQSFENQIEDEQSDESERSQISELKDIENCQSSGDTQIINCKEDDSTCVSYTKKEVYSQLLKDKLKYSLVIVCVSRLNFKENSNFQSDQLFMDILNKWYDKNKLCKIYVSHAEIILQQETYKSHQNLKYIKQNFPKTPIVWEQIYSNQYRQFQIVKELNIDPNDILNFQTQIQYQPKVQSFSPNQIRFKVVLTKEDPYNPSIAHNENIWKIISQKLDQKILVYCQRKFRTIELSKYINYQINQMGNSEVKLSEANNSDLTEEQKKDIKERWNSNELKIVVTTTKFQYKVKNKDCQVIIHDSTPSSIVQYMDDCQLASDSCTCIMFHHSEDFKRIQRQLFNDFNKDTITEETKESDTLKLNQICQYAKTKDVCRKIMINEFMGNEKNLNNCQVCDNCKWIQKNGVQIKLIQQ